MHGHAGAVQSDHGFLVERLGYFLRLKGDDAGEAWVHYAVPTVGPPVARLGGVVVRFRTWGAGAHIAAVHAWSGARQLAAFDHRRDRSERGAAADIHDEDAERFDDLQLAVDPGRDLVDGPVGVSVLLAVGRRLEAIAIVGVGADFMP